jgi:hypothetical protein
MDGGYYSILMFLFLFVRKEIFLNYGQNPICYNIKVVLKFLDKAYNLSEGMVL